MYKSPDPPKNDVQGWVYNETKPFGETSFRGPEMQCFCVWRKIKTMRQFWLLEYGLLQPFYKALFELYITGETKAEAKTESFRPEAETKTENKAEVKVEAKADTKA